jgi:hypothetical protein
LDAKKRYFAANAGKGAYKRFSHPSTKRRFIMNKTKFISLTAGLVLAITFTFFKQEV